MLCAVCGVRWVPGAKRCSNPACGATANGGHYKPADRETEETFDWSRFTPQPPTGLAVPSSLSWLDSSSQRDVQIAPHEPRWRCTSINCENDPDRFCSSCGRRFCSEHLLVTDGIVIDLGSNASDVGKKPICHDCANKRIPAPTNDQLLDNAWYRVLFPLDFGALGVIVLSWFYDVPIWLWWPAVVTTIILGAVHVFLPKRIKRRLARNVGFLARSKERANAVLRPD